VSSLSIPGDLIIPPPLETPVLDPVSSPEVVVKLWAVIEGEGGIIVKFGASEILCDSSTEVFGDPGSMNMFGDGLFVGALSARALKVWDAGSSESGGDIERGGDLVLEANLLKKLGAMADFIASHGSGALTDSG
jgi:hypothetical protein